MFIIQIKLSGTFEEQKDQRGFVNKIKMIFSRPADFDPELRGMVKKKFWLKNKEGTRSQKFRHYVHEQIHCDGDASLISLIIASLAYFSSLQKQYLHLVYGR